MVVKVGGGLQRGGGPRCFGTAFSSWQAVVVQRRLGVSRRIFAIREHVFPLSVVLRPERLEALRHIPFQVSKVAPSSP